MLSREFIQKSLEGGSAKEENYFGLEYIRFLDDLSGIPRGTVVVGGRTIYGYPRIGRVISLDTGIRGEFLNPFHIEEKVDGYNVRIFFTDGEIFALTRGGFVCPFSTDRLTDLLDIGIFQKERDLILCAEFAGPGNPYNEEAPSYIKNDVEMFVFDLLRKDHSEFLTFEEKNEMIERYNLARAPYFGLFQAGDEKRIQNIMIKLNDENREGIVLKESGGKNRRAKYVTASSCLADIAVTSRFLYDLDSEYFTNRILQAAVFMRDSKISFDDAEHKKLGKAFYDGLGLAVEDYKKFRRIENSFSCLFRKKENAERMIACLKERSPRGTILGGHILEENGGWRLCFERVFPKTTGFLGYLMGGGLMFD